MTEDKHSLASTFKKNPNSPFHSFIKQSDAIKKTIKDLRQFDVEMNLKNFSFEYLESSYQDLLKVNDYLKAKEEALFPLLQEKGLSRLPIALSKQRMAVRELTEQGFSLLENQDYGKLFAHQKDMFASIEAIFSEETENLWPALARLLKKQD